LIEREVKFVKRLNHPLVVNFRQHFPGTEDGKSAIKTEFVSNGSLADHLPNLCNFDRCGLRGSTRIAKIISGIVLAMRYIHSCGIIHRSLPPANILLDWNWNIRITNFGHSHSCEHSAVGLLFGDPRCPPPEVYFDVIVPENDVFSFGLILYELIVGRSAFPYDMGSDQITGELVLRDWRAEIPKYVRTEMAELISDCLANNFKRRPSFSDILERLKEIEFKVIAGVNSSKVSEFVKTIEANETAHLVRE
jgi:sterile alpha motif and leucine zipper-containing kinase AZK